MSINLFYSRLKICYGRVLAWAVEPGGRVRDAGHAEGPAAWADGSVWLQLLPGGRADDGACIRHSRKERLSGLRV